MNEFEYISISNIEDVIWNWVFDQQLQNKLHWK